MAKRKSAALFEVIHSDKRFPKRHGWTFRAPKWLARSASSGAETSSPRGSSSTPMRLFGWVPSLEKLGLKMDPDRQIVRFQLTYTGALVSAFTLVVLIALVYVLGKHTGARPMPALAEATTEELRNGPITPEVLDVGVPTATITPPPAPVTPSRSAQTAANGSTARKGAINEPKPPTTFVEVNSKRSVGMQFVIVQSYPSEEKQLAEEAMQLLCKNGLPCSVEYNLRFAPGWYSVVGYTGFSSTKNSREYSDYIQQIAAIGERFGGGSKFKKFKPMAFTWTERKPADSQPAR